MPRDWERDRYRDERFDEWYERDRRGEGGDADRRARTRANVRRDAFRDEEEFLRGLEAGAGPVRSGRAPWDPGYGYGYGGGGEQWPSDDRRYAGSRLPHPDEARFGRHDPRRRDLEAPSFGEAGNSYPRDFGAEGYGRYGYADARAGSERHVREAWAGGYAGRGSTVRRPDHRGRGPKSYTRSDDRILEDVNDRLSDDGHIDASDIEVEVKDGEVTLSGHVASRFAKRHAEDLTWLVSGVKQCQNNLRVASGSDEGRERGDAAAQAGHGGARH